MNAFIFRADKYFISTDTVRKLLKLDPGGTRCEMVNFPNWSNFLVTWLITYKLFFLSIVSIISDAKHGLGTKKRKDKLLINVGHKL